MQPQIKRVKGGAYKKSCRSKSPQSTIQAQHALSRAHLVSAVTKDNASSKSPKNYLAYQYLHEGMCSNGVHLKHNCSCNKLVTQCQKINLTPSKAQNKSANISRNQSANQLPQASSAYPLQQLGQLDCKQKSHVQKISDIPEQPRKKEDSISIGSELQPGAHDGGQLGTLTDRDTAKFLLDNFGALVACQMIPSWQKVPIARFLEQLIHAHADLLEADNMDVLLIQKIRLKLSERLASDSNGEWLCLDKLELWTKGSGLMGLILRVIQELTEEEQAPAGSQKKCENVRGSNLDSMRAFFVKQWEQKEVALLF